MKYIFVFNLVVFNSKHTKIKKFVFACVYGGGGGKLGIHREAKGAGLQPGKVWEPLSYMLL